MGLRTTASGHPSLGIRWACQRCALGALLGALGCGLSPKPEPPDATGVDLDQVTVDSGTVFGLLDLRGGPGAAEPPGAVLRAYPLDSDGPRSEVTVGSDGSFLIPGIADPDGEVRLQLIDGATRSDPVDVTVTTAGAPPTVAARPLADCLELQPALELELTSGQSITVRSTCEDNVTLAAPRARRALPELELGSERSWPATLATGEELTVSVNLIGAASFDEAILFIEAISPVADRRPLTIRPP